MNIKAGQHSNAQCLAAVDLCARGFDPERVGAVVGVAPRTLRHWTKRAKEGGLVADEAKVEAAVLLYESQIGDAAPRPAPRPRFDKQHPKPKRALLPDPPAWQLFDPQDPKTLDKIKEGFGLTQESAREPSEDAQAVAALLGAERVPPVHMQPLPSDLNPDVQQLATSYGPQAVWYLAALARAMSENKRLPGWQMEQFKAAAGIWSKLAGLAAPRPKMAEYVPPRVAAPIPKRLGDVLGFLGDLIDQVSDPQELAVLESLVKRISAGEVVLEQPNEPMQ